MKRTKLLLVGLLAAVPLLGWAVSAQAQSFHSGNSVTVGSKQVINSTLFASGNNIDVAGIVRGDVFCVGQTINISGRVTGDVICAGQNIHISGTVDGDVRLAGQSISVDGTINRNASIASQSFSLSGDARIGGDASLATQDATLNGTIGRDVAAASGTVTIDGQVGRNVQANVEHLRLRDDAAVKGAITYTSANNLEKDSSATVDGKVTRHEPAKQEFKLGVLAPFLALYFVISMLILALVLVLLLPRTFHVAGDMALASPGKTLLIGFLSSIIVPILLLAAMFTVIGIPVALLGWLIWLVVAIISGPFAAYLLGRVLLRGRTDNVILTMLLGAIILLLLYLIPFINIIVALFAHWFGLGMIMRRAVFVRPQYNFAHATSAPEDTVETKVKPAAAARSRTTKTTSTRSKTAPSKRTSRAKR